MIEICDECPAQLNCHISVATSAILTNNTPNESLHVILSSNMCGFNINFVFDEIHIKYLFFNF